MPRAIRHTKPGLPPRSSPPRRTGPGPERPNQPPAGWAGQAPRGPPAAHRFVPAFHEAPGSFRTSGRGRTRPCITASRSTGRTGPASGGRSRTRRRRMGGRTRSRWAGSSSVVSPHTACGQVREPAAPVEAGPARAQVRPFALRPRDHGHGTLDATEGQPGLVPFDPGRQGRLRVGHPAGRHRLHVPPQGGGPRPAARQGRETGQTPQTGAVHVQVGHRLPEGLRSLAGGDVGRQGRGAAQTGLALPALDAQASQHDQMAGMGAVAPPGTGPATGAGARSVGQRTLAFGVVRGWD